MLYKETAEIGGKKLAFVRQNDWSEDVILFFHGFCGSKEYFPELPDVKDCIISFDRPGVGDSDTDIVTAYNSEMDCISCTWGYRSRKFLVENGALFICTEPVDLRNLMR